MSSAAISVLNRQPSLRQGGSFVAADVGGTHVRLAQVECSGHTGHAPQLQGFRQYRCADHASLATILADFLADTPEISEVVIASAGFPLADGTVITANLPWPLSPKAIQTELDLEAVHLVNDFEAVAYAATQMDASEVLQLTGPSTAPRAPKLVLGPGTGLGAAVWIPTGERGIVLATEAGQAALAVRSELEMAVLQEMLKQRPHVSIEHAISGPGLLNLYRSLCAVRGSQPLHSSPDAVSAAALANSDPLALEAAQMFCELLGSVVGDMALLYGAQGGIYLAGGILPKIRELLVASRFVERFLDKGPMREALQRIPVKLVEHGQLGIVGAARWYLDQKH